MTEADITKKSVKMLRKRGHFAVKLQGGMMQTAGLADISACICGHFVAIEMKKPETKDKLTPRQEKKLREVKEAGGIAVVCWSVEMVENLAKRIEAKYARAD